MQQYAKIRRADGQRVTDFCWRKPFDVFQCQRQALPFRHVVEMMLDALLQHMGAEQRIRCVVIPVLPLRGPAAFAGKGAIERIVLCF